MSIFQKLCTVPASAGCTTIFSPKSIPEKLISFHRACYESQVSGDYHTIFLADVDFQELFAQLSITFLGAVSWYALKDGDISASQRKKLDAFLKGYTGPHYIFFFTSEQGYAQEALFVDTAITKKLFQELTASRGSSHPTGTAAIAPSFIERMYAQRTVYTFDEALLLFDYAHLIGARHELFFTDWLNRLLVDDLSLFTLSNYFFGAQKSLLAAEWLRLKDRYPAEFWIAFFSEQLWQAALYIQGVHAGQAAQAKRYAYRLPFSFFQKEYKRYTIAQLAAAHALLYDIDHGLKNGHASHGLDLFVMSALEE